MQSALLLAYIGTVGILTLTPGPSVMLGSAHGMRYGARGTLPTIAGDLSANALQMLAAAIGLGAIIVSSAAAFTVIKWAGVAYLAWMGINHLRHADDEVAGRSSSTIKNPWARYGQGFVTSASNPKAIVFFAALFPQFIDPSTSAAPIAMQFLLLGFVFIVIDGTAVFLYAATAGRMASWLSKRGRVTAQRRLTGVALLGAAGLLSLKGAPAPAK
ncbi:MAG: LysE family translocator [Acidimicrobiia bacterium]|nr:LysE family translocator [Acidimicrobiia bacterium]